MRGRSRSAPLVVTLAWLSLSCAVEDRPSGAGEPTRETLASGAVKVSYPSLPTEPEHRVDFDLRIGSVAGDAHAAFGDIRGFDVARDGTIYVLDHQASEIRAFDERGAYVRTLATAGDGPGEITAANGLVLVGDSLLWVQDHGKMSMLGLSRSGEEVARFPMHVRSFAYTWNGTVDESGRVWKILERPLEDGPPTMPAEGWNEGASRIHLAALHPTRDRVDTIHVGRRTARAYVTTVGSRGFRSYGIPFDPEPLTAVDLEGRIWHTDNQGYLVVRLGERGDTTLVLEAFTDRAPVTDRDREHFVAQILESNPEGRADAERIVEALAPRKPWIMRMSTDDRGRLWVRRHVAAGDDPLFDVFEPDGTRLATVALAFEPVPHLPVRVRHGYLLAATADEFGVPYLVRAPVPEL